MLVIHLLRHYSTSMQNVVPKPSGLTIVQLQQTINHVKWCPPSLGYYLCHPNRRQTPPALAALIHGSDEVRVVTHLSFPEHRLGNNPV